MYGPYPAYSLYDTAQLDASTGTLYWILSSTYNGTDTYAVVISYISRDIILHSITCSVNVTNAIGNGQPSGRLLRDSSGNFYINVENGYGYSTWHQFDSTGSFIADLGGISFGGGPLNICQDADLDGAGNLIHLTAMGANITIVTLSPFAVSGSVAPTYTGSSRVAIGQSNSIWVLSTDGSNGAVDLVSLPPGSPSVTSFLLGSGSAFVTYTIEYDSTDDTLLFWWNDSINKWSCSLHTVINSINVSGIGYIGSGPLQAGLLTSGIGFYDASTLAVSPITGVGFNPGLPPFGGGPFKHYYDSAFQVIWLHANDNNVYGAVLGGFPLLLSCASGVAELGVRYGSFLTATGGTPPYMFSIISGALPPLLTLNSATGAITGIPTQAGSYPYTAQVTDSLGVTAINSCAIIIPITITQTSPMPTLEITRDIDADWDDESTFYITQSDPFPFTLRGLALRMSYNQD